MPTGSCLCGKITVSYDGAPAAQGLCYCVLCRKLTGSTYSTNVIIPAANLKVTGSPKAYTPAKDNPNTADSGNVVTNYFCGDCSTPLYNENAFPGANVVRAGIFDSDADLNNAKPVVEAYSERRPTWCPPVDGALSMIGMGDAQELAAKGASA